jgi:hypothetical protein
MDGELAMKLRSSAQAAETSAEILVPPWICSPLGRHYRYYADELTQQLRLAYADDPAGPWSTFRGFPLGPIAKVIGIAANVDHDNHQIRVTCHVEYADGCRHACLASSTNGLRFRLESSEGTFRPERPIR